MHCVLVLFVLREPSRDLANKKVKLLSLSRHHLHIESEVSREKSLDFKLRDIADLYCTLHYELGLCSN